jgi:hypothetical protein
MKLHKKNDLKMGIASRRLLEQKNPIQCGAKLISEPQSSTDLLKNTIKTYC